MGSNAKIGFHAARVADKPADISPAGNAMIGAYLYEIGITDLKTITYLTMNTQSMTWLSLSAAIKWKIDANSFAFTQSHWLWAAAKMDPRNHQPSELHSKRIDTPGHFPATSTGTPPIVVTGAQPQITPGVEPKIVEVGTMKVQVPPVEKPGPAPHYVKGGIAPVVPRAVIAVAPGVVVPQPTGSAHNDFIAEASRRLERGDVAGAREILAAAADGSQGPVLFALAETYDPNMLSAWGRRGVAPDIARAREFYRKALSLGVAAADDRLRALPPESGSQANPIIVPRPVPATS